MNSKLFTKPCSSWKRVAVIVTQHCVTVITVSKKGKVKVLAPLLQYMEKAPQREETFSVKIINSVIAFSTSNDNVLYILGNPTKCRKRASNS